MVNTRGFARLGMLAVGVGIGAAWAHTPVAAADSSSDWLSSIDGLLSGALPAADPSGLNLAISFDGMSLVQDGNATATTASGEYGLAIAYGDGAAATAEGGTGNYALADGTNAERCSGRGRRLDRQQLRQRHRHRQQRDAVTDGDPTAPTLARATCGDPTAPGAAATTARSTSATTPAAPWTTAPTPLGLPWRDDIASVVGNNSYAASGGRFDPAAVGDNDIATVFDPFGTVSSTAVAGEGSRHPR